MRTLIEHMTAQADPAQVEGLSRFFKCGPGQYGEGDHVQTWLNGEPMADIRDEKIGAAQGRIALQIHDGGGIKVLWRNIRITEL